MENIEKLNEAVKVVNDAAKAIEKANLSELNGIKYTVRQTLNAMLLLETKAFQDIERLATQRRAELQEVQTIPKMETVEEVVSKMETPTPVKKAKKAKKSGK